MVFAKQKLVDCSYMHLTLINDGGFYDFLAFFGKFVI